MPKSYELNREKLEQARRYLAQERIDCWMIKTKEGSDPCMPLIFGLTITGDALLAVTPEKVVAVVSTIDAQDVENSGLFDDVITYYPGGYGNAVHNLVCEINPMRIAVNYSRENNLSDGLTVGSFRALKKMVGERYADCFESSEDFLQRLRSIKTPLEIEYIQKAINITLEVYDEVFTQLKKGMTEKEIGQLFVEGMIKRGVVNGITRKLTPPIVMKERISHRPPGDAVLEEGDYLIFDFSVDYKGYTSDIARTCYVLKDGETCASESMQRAFRTIYEAIDKAAELLVPGSIGRDVDAAARNHILDNGYQNIFHAVGHQVGRNVHDGGVLLGPEKGKYKEASLGVIEEGMVFAIEPTILYEEGPAIISEENLLVTSETPKFLSRRQQELVLVHS